MLLAALIPLLVGACTWVNSSDKDCQLKLVDDDGDGYPLSIVDEGYNGEDWCGHLVTVDCNDADPLVHPDAAEIWYDGTDANCLDDDDFDQDADGYVPSEYAQEKTTGIPTSGGLPGGDCDDTLPEVNPLAADLAYDGIDSNCNGKDDFDQDTDGYVSNDHVGLATQYVEGSGALPGGDCDDTLSTVGPIGTDAWYDGVDTDCSGDDDYDQDADGYVPTDYVGLTTLYVDGSGLLPDGDCDDLDAAIWPAAPDTWYDGIDSDCAADDDYDQDLDGFDDASNPAGGDDCDDLNPSAYPGAIEVVGDTADFDCDGGNDSFFLEDFVNFTWSGVSGIDFTEDGDKVYLGVGGAEIVYGTTHYYDSITTLLLDGADPGSGLDAVDVLLQYMSDPVGDSLNPGLELTVDDEAFYGVVGWSMATARQLILRRYDLTGELTNPKASASASIGDETYTFDDVSLAWDAAADLHAIGCSDNDASGAMGYMWVDPATMVSSNKYEYMTGLDVSGAPCTLDFLNLDGSGTVFVNLSHDEGLAAYTFERCTAATGCTITLSEEFALPTWRPTTLEVVDAGGGQRLLVFPDEAAGEIVVLAVDVDFVATPLITFKPSLTDPPVTATARLVSGGDLYIGYTTESGAAGLAYGRVRLGTSLATADFDLDFFARQTALEVAEDGSMLYFAVTGNDETEDRVVFGFADL